MSSVAGWSNHPSSTRGTNKGQAWTHTGVSGRSALMARSYAPLAMVPAVPITPIFRDRAAGGEVLERLRADGVAGHDQGFHAAPEQVREDLARVAPHRVRRLGAVGDARRVAEVDHGFVRQALEQRARHREAPDPRVEHAERSAVHGRGTGTLSPTPPGNARTLRSLGKSWRCADTNASAPENRWLKIHRTSQSCTSCRLAPTLTDPASRR